jgi:hypothetical protein
VQQGDTFRTHTGGFSGILQTPVAQAGRKLPGLLVPLGVAGFPLLSYLHMHTLLALVGPQLQSPLALFLTPFPPWCPCHPHHLYFSVLSSDCCCRAVSRGGRIMGDTFQCSHTQIPAPSFFTYHLPQSQVRSDMGLGQGFHLDPGCFPEQGCAGAAGPPVAAAVPMSL